MKNLAMQSVVVLTSLGISSGLLYGQEFSRFTYGVGAGSTTVLGNTGSVADTGWNVRGDVGYNFNRFLGVGFNMGYDSVGVNSATLANIGTTGGSLNVFSLTIDPVVHLTRGHPADLYVFGGGGYFRQEVEFSQPSTNLSPGYYPVFGYYPGFSSYSVVGNNSVNKAGIDAGMGVNIKAFRGGKAFAEARYERVFLTNGYHSDFLPVTFGYRW